jgi:hypothetical protein
MPQRTPSDEAPAPSPALARALEQVASLDPLLVEAADEVDLGLIRWSLSLSPVDRLRSCSRAAAALARLDRGPSPDR